MSNVTGKDYAFPDATVRQAYGLTKREYYACAAMHGLLASGASYDMDRIEIAAESVKYAEALQAALAAQQPVNDNESGGKG